MLAGILISQDLPRQGIESSRDGSYGNTESRRRGQRRENQAEREREGVRVARPGATLTVPDLNMQHQIKHPLMRSWVTVSSYRMQQIHTHIHKNILAPSCSCL